jgi:peptidoglycan/LPS O-acetylase OafA/YrhL
MAKRYYRPELDALRFFAFLSVFCDHLTFVHARWLQPFIEAGAFGMCMFFMLSAYLIITILLREKESTGKVDLRKFAVRRVLRIWPLYFLVLFSGYALGRFYHGSATVSGNAVLAFSFLVGNLYILHTGWLGPVGSLWSLSVEEQFYLAVPAVTRIGGRRGVLTIGIVAISFAYIVLLRLGFHGAPSRVIWVNSFVQFQFFAAGGLMALWLDRRTVRLSLIQRAALAVAGLASWFEAGKLFPLQTLAAAKPLPLVSAFFLVLLGTFLIFISVLDIQVHIPRQLIYLGKISYGLYLFFLFFLWLVFDTSDRLPRMIYFQHHKLIGIPLALGLTIATAALSYHFFERPILKFKERYETIHTRPA